MWARERCRIIAPRFLADCRKKRVNQGCFVCCFFALFAFSRLCLVFVMSILNLFSVRIFQRVPTWIWHCSLYPNFADVPLRSCSAHSLTRFPPTLLVIVTIVLHYRAACDYRISLLYYLKSSGNRTIEEHDVNREANVTLLASIAVHFCMMHYEK